MGDFYYETFRISVTLKDGRESPVSSGSTPYSVIKFVEKAVTGGVDNLKSITIEKEEPEDAAVSKKY